MVACNAERVFVRLGEGFLLMNWLSDDFMYG